MEALFTWLERIPWWRWVVLGAFVWSVGVGYGDDLRASAARNRWTWAVLQEMAHGGDLLELTESPPPSHKAAALWAAAAVFGREEGGLPPMWRNRLVAQAGQDPEALRLWGYVAFREEAWPQALQAWYRVRDGDTLRWAAGQARQQRRWNVARAFYQAALAVDMETTVGSWASFLWSRGERSEAIRWLRLALVEFPTSKRRPQWRYLLGAYLRSQKALAEAAGRLQALCEDVQLPPESYYRQMACIQLGWVRFEQGDAAMARSLLFQAWRMNPQRGDPLASLAGMLAKQGRKAEAVFWYRRAFQVQPNRWWLLAAANIERSVPSYTIEEALATYAEVVRRWPDWAPGYYEMGWALHLAGQEDEAEAVLERAIALASSPSPWYFNRLGIVRETLGDVEGALQAYRQALTVDPDNGFARRKVEELSSQGAPQP